MNINTTPNKEVVRRICVINKANFCYLLVDFTFDEVVLFTNIPDNLMFRATEELASWAGMNFKVFNENSDRQTIDTIKNKGEKILPIVIM